MAALSATDAAWVESQMARTRWWRDNRDDYVLAYFDLSMPDNLHGRPAGGAGWPSDECSLLLKHLLDDAAHVRPREWYGRWCEAGGLHLATTVKRAEAAARRCTMPVGHRPQRRT